jgi:hypothetical protein
MAEFTATADKFHVHVTDGFRTAEYDVEAATADEAIAEAKRRWTMRAAATPPVDEPAADPVAEGAPAEPASDVEPAESGAPAA